MLTITPIPAFTDNYIWAISTAGENKIAVVDPGDAQVVENYLSDNNLTLAAILITHHHHDHTGGVAELMAHRDIPVYGPSDSPFKGSTVKLRNNDQFELLGNTFSVREIPGHTLDHISYWVNNGQSQLFCGDTLFLAGCGRLFEGTPKQMLQAMDYFNTLPDNTEVYCTHEYSLANLDFAAAVEPDNNDIQLTIQRCKQLREQNKPTLPTSIAEEKKINPFMRTQHESVVHAAGLFSAKKPHSAVEVLAAIREWKNQF